MSNWQKVAGIDQLPPQVRGERLVAVDWRYFAENSSKPQIAWLGHATFLIVWKGQRILLDPVFARFVGVFPRRCPVPVDWSLLRPDSIFLSHAHMDHLHPGTLSKFKSARIYLPKGSERFLRGKLKHRCELMPEHHTFNLGPIQVSCVPARHGGWRYPWQKGCHAFGYVLSDGERSIYYAGDTAHGDHFAHIAKSFQIDTALLPIGAYAPRWFLKSRHLNPEEAIAAFSELKAIRMIPYHFGSYRLSWETLDEPLPRFAAAAVAASCEWFLPIGLPA